ncbi:MAG: hypothetical protein K1X83_15090 [Oligoflexia bacterium]|nr:hypothetical protein [Oligoflexia bacterium]
MSTITTYVKLAVVAPLLLGLGGCSVSTHRSAVSENQTAVSVQAAQPAPGVVQYVWEEPMVDTIDVPPGLDPEGNYYRPSHKAVVEVRQGRWKYHHPQ